MKLSIFTLTFLLIFSANSYGQFAEETGDLRGFGMGFHASSRGFGCSRTERCSKLCRWCGQAPALAADACVEIAVLRGLPLCACADCGCHNGAA